MDGVQYMNVKIQESLDLIAEENANIRAEEVKSQQQTIINERNFETASMQATVSSLQTDTDVERIARLNELQQENPDSILREFIAKWDGSVPMIVGGDGEQAASMYTLQSLFGMIKPVNTPIPVPSPTPSS